MSIARITRDYDDVKKRLDWFIQHSPTPEIKILSSISTGVSEDDNIKCQRLKNVDLHSYQIVDGDFHLVKFRRIYRAKALEIR